MYILSFDIGGTSVKYGILDGKGHIYDKNKFKTPQNDIDELMTNIVEVKNQYEQIYKIEGIAISCPGAVDSKTGYIGGASAVPCIHSINFKKKLIECTGMVNVAMENDANCAGLAEVWKGAAKSNNDAIFIIFGSGIGGAIIKDRKIHRGAHLQGGELGYMIIAEEADVLSNLASPVNMAKRVARRKGVQELTGKEVFELSEAGDVIAKEELEKFYNNIAVAVFNLQYIFDPEVVVIGGAISVRVDILESIEKAIDKLLDRVQINEKAKIRPVIRRCEFMNDANLIGAVYNFIS